MKIAIVGTGAMGSVYAGLLASGGNEVWAVDLWQEHVDAINRDGLRVEGASGDRTVRLSATSNIADVGECDLVVIATKASGVAAAAASIEPLLRDDTLILTIQNGLGAGERISRHRDPGNILLGVAGGFGASMKGPGHVHHNGMELIRVGEMQGGLTERVENVARIWRDAGFNVKAYEDVNQLIWEKFICNVTFSGPCTVTRTRIGEMMDDPHGWPIALECGLEAYRAGKAKGVHFSFADASSYITDFGNKLRGGRPSMLLDHMAGRRSEIDAINGMVPVVAREVGTEAPVNEVISALVRTLERDFPT
ncbi:MAG: 2-dehydropantoate 2-reductase [Gammaproteobacteria bacterium]|nr:2-dehydropantoate 2-reductase [Gammaproteobacteria bacterium]